MTDNGTQCSGSGTLLRLKPVLPNVGVDVHGRHVDATPAANQQVRLRNVDQSAGVDIGGLTISERHSIIEHEVWLVMLGDELLFAQELEQSFGRKESLLGLESKILPFGFDRGKGSTDVGDVSWMVPTAGLNTATWVPGTSAHSWQAIAAGGMSIGIKGMMIAAKTLALTTQTLMMNPDFTQQAEDEMIQRRGRDFVYRPLLGDRDPPLNYRNTQKP